MRSRAAAASDTAKNAMNAQISVRRRRRSARVVAAAKRAKRSGGSGACPRAKPVGRPNASRSAGVTVTAAPKATRIPIRVSQANARSAPTGVTTAASRLTAVVSAPSSIGSAIRRSARTMLSAGARSGAARSSS